MNRILIVDDEQAVLNSLQRLIRSHPCRYGNLEYTLEVETFADPQAALQRAAEIPFDLVISDYQMPGMNGIQFLGRIRELQPDAARMVLSGIADLDMMMEGIRQIDTSRFMPKPWNDAVLLSSVAETLTLRELALERRARETASGAQP